MVVVYHMCARAATASFSPGHLQLPQGCTLVQGCARQHPHRWSCRHLTCLCLPCLTHITQCPATQCFSVWRCSCNPLVSWCGFWPYATRIITLLVLAIRKRKGQTGCIPSVGHSRAAVCCSKSMACLSLWFFCCLHVAACVCCIASCCSGTVVAVGPGKYDKDAEGGRKQMIVQKGDKVGRMITVLEVNATPMHVYRQSVM